MKADPLVQRKLLDLAAIDSQIQKTRVALRKVTSESSQALQSDKAEIAEKLRTQIGVVEELKKELQRIEDDVATAQARFSKDRELLGVATEAKEIAVLSAEMDKLTTRIDVLETREIEMLETLSSEEQVLTEVQISYEEISAQITNFDSERQQRLDEVQNELDSQNSIRDELAKEFPADLLSLYNKQLERYGVGASELVGSVTSATGISIPATELAKIRATDPEEVILCPDSSAILVR